MGAIGVKFDSRALRDHFREGQLELFRETTKVLKTVTETARVLAMKRFTSRTGKLGRSIRATRASATEYVLKATAPHAGFVEHGTRAHAIGPILPKRGRVLRFEVGGKMVFTRRVREIRHPGTKATHFLSASAHEVLPLFQTLMVRAARKAFER